MTPFDDLQNIWNQQNNKEVEQSQAEKLIVFAERNTTKIKEKQSWTMVVLGLSFCFVFWYALIYLGLNFSWFHAGLFLMLSSLLSRFAIEYRSYLSLSRIDIQADFTNYSKALTAFYRGRKRTHYVTTPLLAVVYVAGFLFLLSVFRVQFSRGFFMYILISGISLLIVFAALISRQIKKEVVLLEFLKKID